MAKYMQDSTDIQINEVSGTDNINFTLKQNNSLVNLLFPIGQIIIKGDNKDYSNWLGFTWERTAVGKVLVGYDNNDVDFNNIGKTGGEKEHTLTIDEMPSHGHTVNYSGSAGTSVGVTAMGDQLSTSSSIVQATGGGHSHNNLQPYQVVAYWKRVS